MAICVAVGNKVMDTRDWHIQWGVPPKYDVSILAVILATTPNWLWSARIHNVTAVAMPNALPLATKSWILGIGTSSGVCHPRMTFLPSLSFLPPHPTGCGRRESITPLRKQCRMCVAVGNKVMDSPVCLSL